MDTPKQNSSFEINFNLGANSGITEVAISNREIVIKAYEALRDGDVETWLNMFDDDVVFKEAESLPYGGVYSGKAEAIEGLGKVQATWNHPIIVDIEEVLAAGDLVILYLRLRTSSANTNKEFDSIIAEVLRLKNGKAIEWRPIYFDTHKAREICGLK